MAKCSMLLLGILLMDFSTSVKSQRGIGTVRNLEEIIIGRCYNYIRVVNPTIGEKNCSAIWEAFQNAFAYKKPYNVLPTDYKDFINLARHDIPRDKALFWENTKLLVNRYSDQTRRMMPLGDALIGFLADDLNWCGQPEPPGINYEVCPTNDSEDNPVNSFWKIASESYAKEAAGIVTVMLNGSVSDGTFPKEGFFAKNELPNLRNDKVSEIQIWVMDNIDGPVRETCGTGTVKDLEDIIKGRNFSYSCTDNYRVIRLLQCVDLPNHPTCKCI
ncbi:ADP-ribosyl cyclase/cyclic ADP-ribose hydrolase 2-like isoform X2 [Stegostoma tigrinum]|uniref:ADP-ribosyl cyclase/cyclic ADP-ribose hydrolase 2-like isoform X2 n=1 Tax=Stegostoma tigrinum TaxID=3053191 RepID=UPI00202B43B4|nr:ADP-ribosyl cyclase/cyclic ADP-ribose hydrolase 2-like isoform X2 [Stegostoma tigrinum]